jgi:sulfur-carrier protein
MAVIVRIPTPLQALTNHLSEVGAEGATVRAVMNHLDEKYPGLKGRIYDDNGKLRRFVNIYVNDEDIRFLENEDTPVPDGAELSIIPSIAGGVSTDEVMR